MNKGTKVLALASLIVTNTACAQSIENQLRSTPTYSLFAGMTNGGDIIARGGKKVSEATSPEAEPDVSYSEKLKAGGFFAVGGGVNFALSDQINIQLNTSYHWDQVNDPDIKFSRFEFEIIPYYQVNHQIRLGLGVTHHFNIKSTGKALDFAEFNNKVSDIMIENTSQDIKTDFSNATGLIASVGYQFEGFNSLVELRAVKINYDANMNVMNQSLSEPSSQRVKAKGDHIGVYFHWLF